MKFSSARLLGLSLRGPRGGGGRGNLSRTDSHAHFGSLGMTEVRNSWLGQLKKSVPDWQRLAGESGYQHNGQHLGKHTEDVINEVLKNSRYAKLPPGYQEIVLLAAFFHDMGKPTGKLGETVPRVINHEEKSGRIAGLELKKLEYDAETIRQVRLLIKHDNLMSEYGRKKLHGENYFNLSNQLQNQQIVIARSSSTRLTTCGLRRGNLLKRFPRDVLVGDTSLGMTLDNKLMPPAISKRFNYDKFLLTSLLILNKADVIAAGRGSGKPGRWGKIRPWVNEYFLKCLKEAK